MDFEKEIFHKRIFLKDKLIEYGFNEFDDVLTYEKHILNDQFNAKIVINNNKVTGELIDLDSGDIYNLFRNERFNGEFIGRVREAYADLLKDIANKCTEKIKYGSLQAIKVDEYIFKTYQVEADFPWVKFEDYGVYRNKENNLWFGLIMYAEKDKLAKDVPAKWVINVKPPKEIFNELLKLEGIYPGWHMNKKSWISISLDDSFKDDYIFSLIDASYNETIGKKKVRMFPPKKY